MLVRRQAAGGEPLPAAPSHKASINGWTPDLRVEVGEFEVPAADGRRLTHQLFRFPAKFHAPVIRKLISDYTQPGERLLDVFCGSGTLLVEASVAGRHAVGFDVDPLSVFLSHVKSQDRDCAELRAASEQLLEQVRSLARTDEEYRERMHNDLSETEYEEQLGDLEPPAIPNLFLWFRRYVIVDLARLRSEIEQLDASDAAREALMLVFAAIIRGASNADPVPVSGLERTKHMIERDEAGRLVNPFALFERRLARALDDFEEYIAHREDGSACRAERADVTATLPLRDDEAVHAALCSPPYHGAVDYYRRHQLEMFWLRLTDTQDDRLRLLDQYLGRPHVPQKHRFVLNTDLAMWEQAALCERQMREDNPGRADQFRHYCVGMSRAFKQLAGVLAEGAPAIFIVGHSSWNGDELDTSNLFTELARPWFELDEQLHYPVFNRHMSYGRRNGANIEHEFILVFRRTARAVAA